MAINKIIINNEVKLDLTQDTITPEDVKKGKTFHGANGEIMEGNFTATLEGTTAEATDVRSGKKFYNVDGELVSGSLGSAKAGSVQWSFYDYNGNVTCKITAAADGIFAKNTPLTQTGKITSYSLIPENIRSGQTVLGVTGTYNSLKDFLDGMESIEGEMTNDIGGVPAYFATLNQTLKRVQFDDADYVDTMAFSGCSNLEDVILPNVTVIEVGAFSSDGYGDTAIPGPKLSGEVILPKVTSIYNGAFSGSQITSADFPEVANPMAPQSNLPNGVFSGCKNLTTVNMPKLDRVGWSYFDGCTSLVDISLPSLQHATGDLFYNCTNLETVDLPEATYIGPISFYNCKKLKSVNLPKLQQLPPNFLVGAMELTELVLPEVVSEMYAPNDNTFVQYWGPDDAQSQSGQYTTKIERLILPKYTGRVMIGFGQSLGCGGPLRELDLRSVTKIDTFAFDGFANLETIHLDACENLDGYTFDYCPKLQEINLPSIKIMRAGDFSCCDLLRRVELGENLVQIGSPFPQCPSLTTVIIRANQVPTLTDAITTTGPTGAGTMSFPSQATIYVKDELVDEYKAADGWILFASQIKPLSELQEA